MITLFDKVLFDSKTFSELTDLAAKREIEQLIFKLRPLESEIIRHEDADITITKSGNIFTVGFPEALGAKISKIITGKQ